MASGAKDLAIAELAIYLLLTPILLYLLYSHRLPGILGWLYLLIFATFRLTSSGLEIGNSASTTAAILSAVGLSPLLLALAGILHEAQEYLSPSRTSEKKKLPWAFQIFLHLLTITAVTISAIGGANLAQDAGTSKYTTDLDLRKIGSMLLLVAFLVICGHVYFISRIIRTTHNRSAAQTLAISLFRTTLSACALILVRLIYTIIYSFAKQSSSLYQKISPYGTGSSLVVKIILVFLIQLLAVLSFVMGGILSRRIYVESKSNPQQAGDERLSGVEMEAGKDRN